ncbi:IS3 family transposase [archaeon]|nr:MAG: IS3 family transposase [archaeon]
MGGTAGIASVLGYSRQALYKRKPCRASRESAPKALTRQLVDSERSLLPRVGTRKLHYLIGDQLKKEGVKCGRDKLMRWLREDGLLILPRRRYIQTTNSKHHFRKYENLAKDLTPSAPEQLWVSDITYIRSQEGWMYLSLITDAFSRKIVGYSIADNMEAATIAEALKMALNGRLDKTSCPLHHSDRGIQYCSKEYTELAIENGLKLSMTQNGDPYENALAERMNRTLKEEFGLGKMLPDKQTAIPLTKQAVALYNNRRPHLSLNMKTPEQVHKKSRLPEATGTI